VLSGVYDALGFAAVGDAAFRALVLGRIIEPTSKVDTIRVLTDLGVAAPSRATFRRCLQRIIEKDYRATITTPATGRRPARAGWRWCSTT
jgi:hypothetical protein